MHAFAGANGPAAPRRRDGPERRAQILATAAELFAEYGFEQTSMREIAKRVNMLAGSLYHHFATKDDLLHALIREPQQQIIRENERLAALLVDAELRLAATVIARFHQFTANWHVHVLLMQEANFYRQHAEFSYVQTAKNQASLVMTRILDEGIATGLFRAEIDSYLTNATISQMISAAAGRLRQGAFISAVTGREYGFAAVLDHTLDCALRLVRPAARIEAPVRRAEAERLVGDSLGR